MAEITGLLSFTITDKLGVQTSMPLYVETADTNTLANIITDCTTTMTNFDPVIDGQIVNCELKFEVPLDIAVIKTAPAATAEVERNALVNFSQVGIKYKQAFAIPTIADSLIVAGKVNTAATAWITLMAWLISGGTYLKFTSKFINALVAVLDVIISFRKHRKREKAVSYEE